MLYIWVKAKPMNAIRQIVTSDASGTVSIQVPVELRQQPVEIIVLPIMETDDLPSILTGKNATANAWKVIRNAQLSEDLQQRISTLQREAAQNGLTPELLGELLLAND